MRLFHHADFLFHQDYLGLSEAESHMVQDGQIFCQMLGEYAS